MAAGKSRPFLALLPLPPALAALGLLRWYLTGDWQDGEIWTLLAALAAAGLAAGAAGYLVGRASMAAGGRA